MLNRRIRLIFLAVLVCALSIGFAYMSGAILRLSAKAPRASNGNFAQTAPANNALANSVVNVVATAQGVRRSLPTDLMCFNVNSVQIPSWQDPQFISATNRLSPKILRIPGGEVANYWDWQRGGIVEDGEPLLKALPDGLPEYMRYEARSHTASTIENYAAGLAATNTQALFVLNMLTSDLGEQIDMLSAAARAGIEIKYLELGNEYYFGIPNYAHKFPTPEAYGEEAKVWISYLRDIFPDIEIAVFGVAPKAQSSPRELRWNQALLETALPEADAIALHLYPGHGLDPNGFSDSGYPAFDENDFSTIFGEPFRSWQALRDRHTYDLIPADKEIWITEFNLMEDIFGDNANRYPRVMGTWGHGLYAIAMNLTFLEEPRITMACNHDLVENFKFGAILPHNNSFEISAQQSYPVEPMSLSATGQALGMLAKSMNQMETTQSITFSSSSSSELPIMANKDGDSYLALQGWAFSQQDSTHPSAAIILNLSDKIIQLSLSDIAEPNQKGRYQQLSSDPRTLVTNNAALNVRSGTLQESASQTGKQTGGAAITLAPHSVTQLELE